jgi:hypothetical protein
LTGIALAALSRDGTKRATDREASLCSELIFTQGLSSFTTVVCADVPEITAIVRLFAHGMGLLREITAIAPLFVGIWRISAAVAYNKGILPVIFVDEAEWGEITALWALFGLDTLLIDLAEGS